MTRKADISTPTRMITQWEIARRCGLNQATVSLALRNDPRVKKQTRDRILAIAAELGYDPAMHDVARRLVSRRHGNAVVNRLIALLFPRPFPQSTCFARMLQGMLEGITHVRYTLVVHQYDAQVDGGDAIYLPPVFSGAGVDGVIVCGNCPQVEAMLETLRNSPGFHDRPAVSLLCRIKGCLSVDADHRDAGYVAASHLLDLGHRCLLQCRDAEEVISAARADGLRQAIRERQLDPARCLFQFEMPDDRTSVSAADHPLAAFLTDHPEITGIMADNDESALRIRAVLERLGRRVPDNCSLLSFADSTAAILAGITGYRLTTMRLPLETIGAQAIRLLLHRIDGSGTTDEECLTFPTELIIGESTARRQPMPV